MLNGSWTSSAGRVGSYCLLDFWPGIGTGTVARRFPPAPSLPCIDIVWTARHACKPPRAATFFSTIAAAESLTCEGVSPPAAASETANASDIQTASDFRDIDATSFEDFRLRPELSIGSNRITFFARRQAPGEPAPVSRRRKGHANPPPVRPLEISQSPHLRGLRVSPACPCSRTPSSRTCPPAVCCSDATARPFPSTGPPALLAPADRSRRARPSYR